MKRQQASEDAIALSLASVVTGARLQSLPPGRIYGMSMSRPTTTPSTGARRRRITATSTMTTASISAANSTHFDNANDTNNNDFHMSSFLNNRNLNLSDAERGYGGHLTSNNNESMIRPAPSASTVSFDDAANNNTGSMGDASPSAAEMLHHSQYAQQQPYMFQMGQPVSATSGENNIFYAQMDQGDRANLSVIESPFYYHTSAIDHQYRQFNQPMYTYAPSHNPVNQISNNYPNHLSNHPPNHLPNLNPNLNPNQIPTMISNNFPNQVSHHAQSHPPNSGDFQTAPSYVFDNGSSQPTIVQVLPPNPSQPPGQVNFHVSIYCDICENRISFYSSVNELDPNLASYMQYNHTNQYPFH